MYFFLAGIAVCQRRLLMLTPVCTAACSLVLAAATAASSRLLPAYRRAPWRSLDDRATPAATDDSNHPGMRGPGWGTVVIFFVLNPLSRP